jgi:hypothetical protein
MIESLGYDRSRLAGFEARIPKTSDPEQGPSPVEYFDVQE